MTTISKKSAVKGAKAAVNSSKPATTSAKKPFVASKPAAKKAEKPEPQGIEIEVVDYSEKAIALFGTTKPFAKELAALKGRFNRFLTRNGEKQPGWIFAKTRENEVMAWLDTIA